ncbi:small T-antigen [Erythrura gouldiae polyomavirus 1]|uniref:Small T-antigen n=1 Tax=Erythrura gouldiae polyomavirus 1 TaxID=2169903 RepID=A0A0K1ETJ0_9POLY|nr:small T-antigen [Erythrura gouldiae polyomavirus 1]AKT44371.1 small T-antigen [Erythrura gouldiae polyomavirus 1]
MSKADIAELRELLQLPKNASFEKIKAAYRKKALMYHPDKGGDEEKMKRLNSLMEQAKTYDFSAENREEDLYCEESLSSEEEDVSPGPSQRAEDTGYGSFSASFNASFTDSVSALEFQHACTKITKLQDKLLAYFAYVDGQRKQCLAQPYRDLKRAYQGVPWNLFNEHSHF